MRDVSAQDGLVNEKKSPDAIGEMARREGRASDVFDIAVEPQGALDRLADELVAPNRIAHLGAVVFEVFDYLDLAYAAVGVDSQRVCDQLMLADHLVDEEPSKHRAFGQDPPNLLLRCATRHPRDLVDLLHLPGCKYHGLHDVFVSNRKNQRPRLLRTHGFVG